jgi:hypothetical protein
MVETVKAKAETTEQERRGPDNFVLKTCSRGSLSHQDDPIFTTYATIEQALASLRIVAKIPDIVEAQIASEKNPAKVIYYLREDKSICDCNKRPLKKQSLWQRFWSSGY